MAEAGLKDVHSQELIFSYNSPRRGCALAGPTTVTKAFGSSVQVLLAYLLLDHVPLVVFTLSEGAVFLLFCEPGNYIKIFIKYKPQEAA